MNPTKTGVELGCSGTLSEWNLELFTVAKRQGPFDWS